MVMRRTRVILQARLSSTRLPAKVLLPIAGMPVVLLAARRAEMQGCDVVVATSDHESDDILEHCCRSAGLPVFRGPVDDVLARFVGATADLSPNDLCIRLTADNVFPDRSFLATLLHLRESLEVPYLAYGADGVGLPYGLSAEVFTIDALRQSDAIASNASHREHVTSWLAESVRNASKPPFPGSDLAYGKLRCTIDTYQDYLRVARVFLRHHDPADVHWTSLADTLRLLDDSAIGPNENWSSGNGGTLHDQQP